MALETSYSSRSAGSPGAGGGAQPDDGGKYWPLSKLKSAYTDYLHSKREEIDEQIEARRYYNGVQYTSSQAETLRRRRQPMMTYNRLGRKINAVVGQLERLKQDPKAYARTPQHEEGAELATAVLRFVLDDNEWNMLAPDCSLIGAVDGIGGLEMELKQGDKGDPDVELQTVDVQAFFYDPRSYRPDFSDARYMGVGRWIDVDIAKEMFPDVEFSPDSGGDDLTSNSDRENRWFSTYGTTERVRIVEIWYRHQGKWCWGVFTGDQILKEGPSPFVDEQGQSACKFIMFSAHVDHDGDRYGFVRNLKSPQDGINARQSKMQHILNSKRLVVSQSAVNDIEKTRTEWARPDGVIITNNADVRAGVMADDQSFDFAGWSKMYEQSIAEIEQYGVNSLGLMEGEQGKSGRAIALLQQAGIAELGPYILAFRGWKVRVYRAIWNAVQKHWQSERWVRVTDDEGLAQYLSINKMEVDPQTMQPTLVNAIGSLDVDIILDEGPDTINAMQDMYETLSQIVPALAPVMPPPVLMALVNLFVQSSPLPHSAKKLVRDAQQQAAQQPQVDPEIEKAKMQMEVKREENAQNIQLEREKAGAQIQIEREKAAAQLETERQKAGAQLELDRERNTAEMENQRQKNQLDHDAAREKNNITLTNEQDKTAVKTGQPTSHNLKAMEEIAEGFKQGMALIAEAMTKPKQIKVVRDGGGRVVGAQTAG